MRKALDCLNKSLALILAEKGIDKDPLSEDAEVPSEVWLQIIRDPLADTRYGDKAAVLNDLALEEEARFDGLINLEKY